MSSNSSDSLNMDKKSKYRYLGKNVLLFSISSFGSKILSFLFVSFYTSVLTTEQYGTADLVSTTSSLLLFFVTLNISDAVVRFALEKKEDQAGIFSYGLKVILTGLLIFAIVLTTFSLINPIEWDWHLYLLLYLTVFANALYQITTYYLRAIDEVKSVAVSGIMNTALTIISNIILLLYFKTGVIGYLSSMIIGSFLSSFYAFAIIVKDKKFNCHILCDNHTKKIMLSYSIPLIFNGVSWWINNSLDRYLLSFFCDVSATGIYAVSSKIPVILQTFQTIFSEAWSLSIVQQFDSEDKDGFFANMYNLYNAASVLCASGLILFNVLIAKLLFHNSFFEAWQYSSLLVVSTIFGGIAGMIGGVFSAIKKTSIYALSTIISALINTILNLLLIPRYGALGAAVATLISFIFIWGIRYFYAMKYVKWKINLRRDVFAYFLLVLQLILDHSDNHLYAGQIIITLVLMIIYKDVIIKIVEKIKRKMLRN